MESIQLAEHVVEVRMGVAKEEINFSTISSGVRLHEREMDISQVDSRAAVLLPSILFCSLPKYVERAALSELHNFIAEGLPTLVEEFSTSK